MKHTWVMRSGRALDVRVDEPTDQARGILVVLPPLGRESVVAFRTLRFLCTEAADRGLIVLYASLSGEGDSEGLPPAMDPVTAWYEDVDALVSTAREAAPGLPVHVLGVRAAAALTRAVPAHDGEVRLLWEGISGRSYLRHHTRIRRLSIAMPLERGTVELPGQFFTEAQADALGRLALTDAPLPPGFVTWKEEDPEVQVQLGLCSPHQVQVPYNAVRRLLDQIPLHPQQRTVAWPVEKRAIVTTSSGSHVEEHHVVLEHSLTGILTIPPGTPRAGLVLTASGAELKSGPGSLWATLARILAEDDVMTLRADRRTLGDDTVVSVPHEARPYTAEAVTDVADAVDFLRHRASAPVAISGVCAGGWAGLNAARQTAVDLCVAVNPLTWATDYTIFNEDYYHRLFEAETGVEAEELVDPEPQPAWKDTLDARKLITKRRLLRYFPGLKDLIRGRPDPEGATPSELLLQIPSRTDVHLVLGAYEYQGLPERSVLTGPRRPVRNLTLERLDIDHSLLSYAAQRAFIEHLRGILQAWMPGGDGTSDPTQDLSRSTQP